MVERTVAGSFRNGTGTSGRLSTVERAANAEKKRTFKFDKAGDHESSVARSVDHPVADTYPKASHQTATGLFYRLSTSYFSPAPSPRLSAPSTGTPLSGTEMKTGNRWARVQANPTSASSAPRQRAAKTSSIWNCHRTLQPTSLPTKKISPKKFSRRIF